MAFTALTPAEVAPDQPGSTTLLDKIRTNFDDHEARLSASSGVIGEILNGSFETAQGGNPNWPDKWTIGQYSGGQVILDAASTAHGKKSLKMLHTVSGGGGGYAESDYVAVSPLYTPPLNFAYVCTAAAMSIEVWARYYAADANGDPSTYLGERRIYLNATANPLTWTAAQVYNVPMAYSTARYVKYRFIGGSSGSTQTGNVWFDAVGVPIRRVYYPLDNPNPINQGGLGQYPSSEVPVGTSWSITVPAGFRWLVIRGAVLNHYAGVDEYSGAPYYNDPYVRFTLSGTSRYSTYISDNQRAVLRYQSAAPPASDVQWNWKDMVMDLGGLAAGTYTLQFRMYSSGNSYWPAFFQCPTIAGVSRHYCTSGFINADGTILTIQDAYNSVPLW